MIDPLEVVIAYVKAEIGLVEGRVASKHRFNNAWEIGQAAIVVRQDGGSPDIYVPVSYVRLELRFYGSNTPEIASLWGTVVALSRNTGRQAVTLSGGRVALLQILTQASGLSYLFDEVIKIDYGLAFFNAIVAEQTVVV